ncbi:hypothetical protein IAT40_002312 [Kwoniella sp. CBS 6097]
MPSLADALETLKTQSEQLAYLSTLNSDPPGRFVQAYLHLPTIRYGHGYGHGYDGKDGNVLNLIRDANDSERRLFKFVGEENQNANVKAGSRGVTKEAGSDDIGGGGGGNKRVEKRDGGLITPLKDLRRGKLAGSAASAVAGGGGGGGGRDEAEIVLRTALKLVDDYHSMPRARAKIANLLDAHHLSTSRLAELEGLITEASKPVAVKSAEGANQKPSRSPSQDQGGDDQSSTETNAQADKPKLTPDEAIKAEEAALRALEASLIPLRKAAQPTSTSSSPPPASSSRLAQSPPPPTTPFSQRTPARGLAESYANRTPGTAMAGRNAEREREMPRVTNSLVNATPRRIDRFSPLKLIGTPRAPIGSSSLRNDGNEDPGVGPGERRRTIFGRPSRIPSGSSAGSSRLSVAPTPRAPFATPGATSSVFGRTSTGPGAALDSTTPAQRLPISDETVNQIHSASQAGEDETVRVPRPRPVSPPALAPPIDPSASISRGTPTTPDRAGHTSIEETTPRAIGSAGQGTSMSSSAADLQQTDNGVEGVDINSEAVKAGIAKIWNTLPDMMRQGVQDGPVTEPEVTSSLQHLYRLSQASLPSPPSPSNSSSRSSVSGIAAQQGSKPITPETILFAHLFLNLFKSHSTGDANAGEVDMNELKEALGSVAKERGFEGASGLGTKMIYAAVGKRVVKIERGKGGSRVRFAE